MKKPSVAVIVLNYNQEKETTRCLETLQTLAYPSFEVLVIDNGSHRNVAELLRGHFPAVSWMRLPENVGFAAGCNRGIRWALDRGAEAVLLLNNDASVETDLLDKMVESAEQDATVGVVGAVIYPKEDPNRPFLAGMRFDFLSARIKRIPPNPKKEDVPVVSGSCLLIKRELLEKLDGLDERFFIYYEETDFCYRARRMGWRVKYDARAKVTHAEGSTFGRASAATRYLYTRNRLLFLSKHCPLWVQPWSFCIRMLQDLLLVSFFGLKGEKEICRAIFYGLEDFWKGRFGKGRLEHFFHDTARP